MKTLLKILTRQFSFHLFLFCLCIILISPFFVGDPRKYVSYPDTIFFGIIIVGIFLLWRMDLLIFKRKILKNLTFPYLEKEFGENEKKFFKRKFIESIIIDLIEIKQTYSLDMDWIFEIIHYLKKRGATLMIDLMSFKEKFIKETSLESLINQEDSFAKNYEIEIKRRFEGYFKDYTDFQLNNFSLLSVGALTGESPTKIGMILEEVRKEEIEKRFKERTKNEN